MIGEGTGLHVRVVVYGQGHSCTRKVSPGSESKRASSEAASQALLIGIRVKPRLTVTAFLCVFFSQVIYGLVC